MWDENELVRDEPTKVFERNPRESELPEERPILLWNRAPAVEPSPDLEIVDVVEIPTRRPPPPRRVAPVPATPSLVEATPTRPGELGYSNELLFADVTPGAFVLPPVGRPPEPPSDDDEGRSLSLVPAALDPPLAPRRDPWGRALKLGAVAAVLLALLSYARGPIFAPPPSPRSAVLLRSPEVLTAVARVSESAPAKKSERPKRARRRAAPLDAEPSPTPDDTVVQAPEESAAEATEVEAQLTEALAPEFNVAAAKSAMAASAGNASACGDGTTSGSGRVSVTFARSGRATAAVVDPSSGFAGTSVGSCIARVMGQTTVPVYSGDLVTVVSRVTVR